MEKIQSTKKGAQALIAYYSWGGTTRRLAGEIRELIGGDLYEIRTDGSYPTDFVKAVEQVKKERETGFIRKFAGSLPDMENYDILLIGFPIWCGFEPSVVDAFLSAAGLDGKIVLPFATSGGGNMEGAMKSLRAAFANAEIRDGVLANEHDLVKPWLEQNGLL